MHAAHIKTAETISIAPPACAQVTRAARPSPVPESFGLEWQRELNARASGGAATSKRTNDDAAPERQGQATSRSEPIFKIDAEIDAAPGPAAPLVKTGEAAESAKPTEAAGGPAAPNIQGEQPQAEAPESAAPGTRQVGAPASASHHRTPATAPASLAGPVSAKTKGAPAAALSVASQTSNPTLERGIAPTPMVWASSPDDMHAGVQHVAATAANVASIATDPLRTKAAPSGPKPSSRAREPERGASPNAAQAAGEGAAPVMKETKAAPNPAAPTAGTHSLAEKPGARPDAADGRPSAQSVQGIQGGLQPSTNVTVVTPQALAPNHGATLSTPATSAGATASAGEALQMAIRS